MGQVFAFPVLARRFATRAEIAEHAERTQRVCPINPRNCDGMTDLSQASRDDLIDELLRRYSTVVIVGVDRGIVDGQMVDQEPEISFDGGKYAAIGMMQYAVARLSEPPCMMVEFEDEEDDYPENT
jgi:hypothetical protein